MGAIRAENVTRGERGETEGVISSEMSERDLKMNRERGERASEGGVEG